MTCPVMYAITCLAVRSAGSRAVGAVTAGFLSQLAAGVRDGITWIFTNSTDFWVRLPSPDLASQPAIGAMQQWLLPVTAAVAVGGMIAAGIRMALTRKANPLLDVGTGLAAIAAAGALGVVVPDLLLRAGDAWSIWVLQASTGGAFISRMSQLLAFGTAPDAIVVVLGVIAMLLGAVQAALMLFRQAAILILAAVLPMAAAGATAPLTRSWMRKILSWMLALICYKPAAAAVYAAAFTLIGTGKGLRTILMGFVMIALSLVAMPVLMRFFTWTTGAVASGGGAAQVLGTAATGAVAMGAMRGGAAGATASEHASYLSSRQSPGGMADGTTTGSSGPPPSAGSGGLSAGSGSSAGDSGAAAGAGAHAGSARGVGAGAEAGGGAGTGNAGTAASGAATAGGPPGGGTPSAGAGLPGTGAGATGTGGAAGVPGGGAGAAAAGAAGPVAAAILAGQALANGARNAANAAGDGDNR